MGRILDFNANRVEYLSLQELGMTVDENSTHNKPFNGVTHYSLWNEVVSLAEKNHIKVEVENIACTDSKNRIMPGVSIMPAIEAQHGKGALEAHLLRRCIGKLTFPEFQDNDNGSAIALNFHTQGLEIAYGSNVWVCSNLNIYGQNFIRTYGKESMPVNKMFEVIENWYHKLGDFRMNDIRVIEEMKNTRITDVHGVIGRLLEQAVTTAYIDSTLESPLNIGNTSTFTKNMLKNHRDILNGNISVYDMQNLATDIIRPESINTQEILVQSNAIGKFFVKMLPESFVESLTY